MPLGYFSCYVKCGVSINLHYGHLVTKNVWTILKYSTPYLGFIVVSCRRVVCTTIPLRLWHLHNTLCSILMVNQSNLILLLIFIHIWRLDNFLSMIRELWSSVCPHNNVYALILSHFKIKLDNTYFNNNVYVFNGVTRLICIECFKWTNYSTDFITLKTKCNK